MTDVNSANDVTQVTQGQIHPTIARMQVLLDRQGYSPGEIDAQLGTNLEKALRAFSSARGLSSGSAVSREVLDKLVGSDNRPAFFEYKVTEADLKGPFVNDLPSKMEALKGIPALGYRNAREGLAEKFHMSEELLTALNPKVQFDKVGELIVVADTHVERNKLPVARVDVDKKEETVRTYDKAGQLIGFYPASVGSEEKPTPAGSLKIVAIKSNPTYRYNPDYKFKGIKTDKAFTLAAGPNNPVGLMWIELSEKGYGIHGTPEPAKVSKSESHGCVRLTNWDVVRLSAGLNKGVVVNFVEGNEVSQ